MSRSSRLLIHTALLTLAVWPAHAPAATLPAGFTETLVAGGLTNPMSMVFAPDGRLFVCLQGGQVRVIKDGVLLPTPFLTVTVDSAGERGLLSVAFDPDFARNHYVYVYYTAATPTLHNRVSRFTASGDVAVAGSETIIFDLDDLTTGFHMGGAMRFGADGKLYISAGDNERPGGTRSNSQTLANLFGKMLRINADGTIPPDNPYYQQATGRNRAIWALGLRNPFTVALHPTNGRMFINDVGENTYEEINEAGAGANYGWPQSEGPTANPSHQGPLYAYSHGSGPFTGCAITGGTFYSPLVTQFPQQYLDRYFFGDYCTGWINTFDPTTGGVTTFASGIASLVGLQLSEGGALYYLVRGAEPTEGAVYRIEYTGSEALSIAQHPVSQTVPIGHSATFSVSASGTPPLFYQWQRNGVNIAGANSSSYTIASVSAADNGAKFRCIVSEDAEWTFCANEGAFCAFTGTNEVRYGANGSYRYLTLTDGTPCTNAVFGDPIYGVLKQCHLNVAATAISNEATLTVTGNSPPVATITEPAAGTLYAGGMPISYKGTGTDLEDGTLGAAAFTWYVDFHHDDHTHPFVQPTTGATGGSFIIPDEGETSTNVWYRIHLTVTDSQGLQTTTFRDVRPQVVTLKIATQRPGLQVTVDGQPFTATYTFAAVVGMKRSIGAPTPQTIGAQTHTFESWSDGGAATHDIVVPKVATTYTAKYRKR